jgi:hypothetical protein
VAELALQPSIATDLRAQAHLALINRLKALDVSPILVYRMASLVDSAVLPMAWQWDVLNPLLLPVASQLIELDFATWDQIVDTDVLTETDLLQYLGEGAVQGPVPPAILYAQYRALILLSTRLHSIMGTLGALQQALTGLGYPNAVIQEGQNTWGGSQYPASQGWAVFRILIDIATVPVGTDMAQLQKRITAIANYWKPARCWLDSVQFHQALNDTLIPAISDVLANIFANTDPLTALPSDFIAAPLFPAADTKTIVPCWNTRYYHTSITYGATQPAVAEGPLVVNGNAIAH